MNMRKKYLRIGAAVLATFFTVSVAGCNGNSKADTQAAKTNAETTKAQTTKEEAKKSVTVTAFFGSEANPPDGNIILQEIRKRTGIDFKPAIVANNERENKLNTLIASNSLPDIIFWGSTVRTKEMVENKIIAPLDDLMSKYGKGTMENKGMYLAKSCTVNGKIYAIPRVGMSYPFTLALRKDWLDTLKLKVPTTLDEYYEVLKAFTKDDPNQDGKSNTIGLGTMVVSISTFQHIFSAYGINLTLPNYVDGKVVPYMMHPDYLEAIKFLNKLYKEGLMEPDFATIPNLQSCEKLWNGIYGAFDYSPVGTTNNWLGRYTEKTKPEFVYAVIKGPKGLGGAQEVIKDNSNFTGITAGSKVKEEAMKLLDYLNSEEGDELAYLGIKDKHYKWNADGSMQYLPPYDTDKAAHRNEGGYVYAQLNTRANGTEYKTLNKITRDALDMAEKFKIKNAQIYEKPEIEREIGTLLEDVMKEAFISLIVSKGDLAKEYESFKNKYLQSGGDKWIEQATKIYKAQEGIK